MSRVRNIKMVALAGGGAVLLGGCSWLGLDDLSWNAPAKEIRPPAPQTQVVQAADGTWLAPVENQQPTVHVVPGQQEANRDAVRRLEEMEQKVAEMRRDMNMMMPALNKLIVMQENLQTMIASQAATRAPAAVPIPTPTPTPVPAPVASPVIAAPVATSAPIPVQAPASAPIPVTVPAAANKTPPLLPAEKAPQPLKPLSEVEPKAGDAAAQPVALTTSMPMNGVAVSTVRLGEHPGKTRIVLETTDEVAYRYDLDNAENILTLSLPGAGWSAQAAVAFATSPFVAGYQAAPDGTGGTLVAIQLKQPAQVLWAQTLPSVGGRHPRLVLDVGPL